MLMLEGVINRYLKMDPEMLDKMAAFDGKVIKIEINGIEKALYLYPTASGIQVDTVHEGEADTILRGSIISLFKMGLVSNVADLLLKGEVEISGDTKLGHQFKNLFSQMDIDWSEPLAKYFGDGIANQVQQSGRKFERWGNETVKSVSSSLSEYLQEESRDVVTGAELDIFHRAVDKTRDDVERLQAKFDIYVKSVQTKN